MRMSLHALGFAALLSVAGPVMAQPPVFAASVQTYDPYNPYESRPIQLPRSSGFGCSGGFLRWGPLLLLGISGLIRMLSSSETPETEPLPPPTVVIRDPADVPSCPFCGGRVAREREVCCECAKSVHLVDDTTVNDTLSMDELLKKATRLFNRGLHKKSLDVYLLTVRKHPDCRAAWVQIRSTALAGEDLQEEARRQIERIDQAARTQLA